MKTLYKWSVEDYHRIIESGVLEGKSVELLEGEIITVSPEKPIHSSRIDTVADYLRSDSKIITLAVMVLERYESMFNNRCHTLIKFSKVCPANILNRLLN